MILIRSLTTIESIAKKKYLSEEASRVESSDSKCTAPTIW